MLCWVDISYGGNIYTKEIGKLYNPEHNYSLFPLFSLENHLLLNIYNHTLSGTPRY